MKRCVPVLLLLQLMLSQKLSAMYVGARLARGFFGRTAGSFTSPILATSLFSFSSRMRLSHYADTTSLGMSSQEGFVHDEQWHSHQSMGLSRTELRDVMYRSSFDYAAPASSSAAPVPPAVALGVSIDSWHYYEPEAYESLNPLQKKLISEADYVQCVAAYKQLEDVRISKFTYSVDGQPVVGFALLPKEAPASGKFPLVVALRGGFNGEGLFHEWAKTDLPYIMRHFVFYAQHGYAVLTSQYRGADGNTNKDQFGGDDVRDVLGLFDVARDMGTIDMQDISLSVFSRGTVMGYKTLQALQDRSAIQAMVIKGGISDLETFVKEDPKYIVPILQQARPDFQERAEDITKDISFVRGAEVLKGIPTLVMHNKNDNVVPAKLSRNLIQALEEQGVEHEAHFFDGKHHQIMEFNDEVQARTIEWLNRQRKNKKVKASL